MLIRFLLSFMVLVLVAGCAIPAKTKVTKDGFTARQKTTEAHRAMEATISNLSGMSGTVCIPHKGRMAGPRSWGNAWRI